MREMRLYGSEGGGAAALPTPINSGDEIGSPREPTQNPPNTRNKER